MKISNQGIEFIKAFEGLCLESYLCPAQKWSIGYGSTQIFGREVKENDQITLAQAEAQLQLDLKKIERIVLHNIKIKITQHQFDSLVSHTYNTGGSQTLFHLINTQAAQEEIKKWMETSYITANGVVLNGLIKRRHMEAVLFFNQKIQ